MVDNGVLGWMLTYFGGSREEQSIFQHILGSCHSFCVFAYVDFLNDGHSERCGGETSL